MAFFLDVAQMAARLKVESNVFGLLIGSYTYPGVTEIENLVSTPSNNHIFSLQVSAGKGGSVC